jgi:hypothetical protein
MSDGEVPSRPSGVPRVFEGRGELLRRRRGLLAGAGVAFVVAAVMFVLGAPAWAAVIEEALAAALFWSWAANLFPVRRSGVLRVDGAGVAMDGDLELPRRALAAAFRMAFAQPIVRLRPRRGSPVDLLVEHDEGADAIVDALGLSVGESAVTYFAIAGKRPWLPVAWIAGAGALSLAATMTVLMRAHGPDALALHPFWASAVYAATVLWVLARARVSVDVGADGILLRRVFRQRFVPYEAIAGVVVEPPAVRIELRTGERVELCSARLQDPHEAMATRIEEALARFEATRGGAGPEALVAPGGRSAARWVRDLREAARAKDYREARLDEQALWRVLEDASAPSATRAGAALALASVDESSAMRLRVAADACAEPRLRVALTRVAEGAEDAELQEALAALIEARR